MGLITNEESKMKHSELFALCIELYGSEFKEKYTSPREAFRDWLNEKTGLNEDHILNKVPALNAWIDALKRIKDNR